MDQSHPVELSASDRHLRNQLIEECDAAAQWVAYRRELMLKALPPTTPTFTLELIDEYAKAIAREIFAKRAREGCGF